MAHEPKILNARPIPSAAPARAGKLDWLIVYQVGPEPARWTIVERDVVPPADQLAAARAAEARRPPAPASGGSGG